jgi:GH35 family endo-1,4-beta-xylanase
MVADLPSFAVDVPGLDLANVYLADAEDQPFRWELRVSEREIAFDPPTAPYGLHVLLARDGEPPVWVSARGLGDGERFSLAEEIVRSKRAQLEARARQLGLPADGETIEELIAAGDALEVAYARSRPVNAAQFMGADATKMYRVDPDRFRERFTRLFDRATVTFYPYSNKSEDFEPVEGEFEFPWRDLLVHHLERAGIGIIGRPLLWLHTIAAQPWMIGRDVDWLHDWLRRRIPVMVGRYEGRIGMWEVVNELHDWADVVHLDHAQLVEVTRLACELTVGAERLISGTDAFGVYASWGIREDGSRVPPGQWTPYTYFRDLVRAGVEFDAIGVQIYAPYRDLLDTVAMLERYESLGKPVVITELGVPSEPVSGGITHAWTPEQQADWAERMYTVLMPRPGIAGVLWYDFVDVQPFLPGGGLLDADGEPKPVYERIERLVRTTGHRQEMRAGAEQRRLGLDPRQRT